MNNDITKLYIPVSVFSSEGNDCPDIVSTCLAVDIGGEELPSLFINLQNFSCVEW